MLNTINTFEKLKFTSKMPTNNSKRALHTKAGHNITKPLNSYLLFCAIQRPKLQANSSAPMTTITSTIAAMWKELSIEEKLKYKVQADELAREYKAKVEEYNQARKEPLDKNAMIEQVVHHLRHLYNANSQQCEEVKQAILLVDLEELRNR
jgi:hypothetical protein